MSSLARFLFNPKGPRARQRYGAAIARCIPSHSYEQLIYTKLPLPHVLKGKHVLLMDPVLGTGATAIMAIRVLLDHDVQEDHIVFLTLIAAPLGLHNVAYAFPEVTIVTTAVDDEIDDRLYVLPGVGNWGNRFFGTE